MKRRDFLRLSTLVGGATLLDSNVVPGNLYAKAKDIYPSDKITWICHTPPGGGFDMIPRMIGPYMTKYLQELSPGCKGGKFVIKNEPAAAGLKAYKHVYDAAPNGYTLGGFSISFVTDVILGTTKFEIEKLTYWAIFNSTQKILFASKNGFKSWKEASEASRKAPLKIAAGQFGRSNHLAGILLQDAIGLNAKFITTTSVAANMSAVIRGDVHAGIGAEDAVGSLMEAKEIRPLLVFYDTKQYPEAVTVRDIGCPEVGDNCQGHRFGIAPPGLPKSIRNLLVEALKKTLANQDFKKMADKAMYEFTPVYGDEAVEMAMKYIQFYKRMEPTLQKYLT